MIRYRLGPADAERRARFAAGAGVVTSLAPVALAVVLLERVGWAPPGAFWAVVAALVALVVVRAAVALATGRRRLRALEVVVTDDAVRVENQRDAYTIARERVDRMVEIDGALGGLRVESLPDTRSGVVYVAHVPRGGDGYADVRARLESWGPVERKGRRGPAVRLAVAVVVVAGIFFVPFLLDDFVARSKLVAAALVIGTWLVMRTAMRGR